jgi:hypothetical protein
LTSRWIAAGALIIDTDIIYVATKGTAGRDAGGFACQTLRRATDIAAPLVP